VFERFTERARQVVVLAADEARVLRHNYIGTEHLLLGLLLEEDGIAARALAELGVELEATRAYVAQIDSPGDQAFSNQAFLNQLPFTPRAKKVLELSLREARALGHDYIGTEHMLLGLVRENEGVAARFLRDAGASPDAIRDAVADLLPVPEAVASPPVPMAQRRRLPTLSLVAAAWVFFVLAVGVGVLIGWAIWG
jgi:ATP-dependent Clp protease ATP-binding subunit ClpC